MSSAADQLAKFKSAIATSEVPALGPQRRPGTMTEGELLRRLESFFDENHTPDNARPLLRSAALLWHDHLDASHNISQGIETRDASWLHGIMHRREPDYGNAKYWFRRVGQHPAFAKLAERTKRKTWDSFAFIDECEAVEQGNDAVASAVLRQIQAIEFDVLVEHLLQSA
jgi:hypothetical protein